MQIDEIETNRKNWLREDHRIACDMWRELTDQDAEDWLIIKTELYRTLLNAAVQQSCAAHIRLGLEGLGRAKGG